MEVHSATTSGVPQPPSRYTDGMNFKLLCRFVLVLHSQTWVLMWVANVVCPPTRQVDNNNPWAEKWTQLNYEGCENQPSSAKMLDYEAFLVSPDCSPGFRHLWYLNDPFTLAPWTSDGDGIRRWNELSVLASNSDNKSFCLETPKHPSIARLSVSL